MSFSGQHGPCNGCGLIAAGLFILASAGGHARPADAAESQGVARFQSWPHLASEGDFELRPMTEKRIGFTLGPQADGRRVIVIISAFRKSDTVSGYTNDLAFDVNGEVMGLNLGDRPRLLNRPMRFRFGPDGAGEQMAATKGSLGLIENWGSARWTLPATPTIDAWLKSAKYKPADLPDPAWLVLEITDLLHPDSYNYVTVKNESRDATIGHSHRAARHRRPAPP